MIFRAEASVEAANEAAEKAITAHKQANIRIPARPILRTTVFFIANPLNG
jgi:hypothetical protein